MKLREIRKKMELSQVEMAGELDVSLRTISNWEAERHQPPKYLLSYLEICRVQGKLPSEMKKYT